MKTKKIKILAASDIHGDTELTKKLAQKAEKEKVDLVVLCGDILGFKETKDIIKPFITKNKKILIIPGNHDSLATIDFITNFYKIKNLHGYSAIYENIGFFGAGGADIGPTTISEKEIFEALEKAYKDLKGIEKKVMVTHMHPKGSLSEFSGFKGSSAITKAIKKFKPTILIHGHIHEASGIEEQIGETKVINVGMEGKIIEI